MIIYVIKSSWYEAISTEYGDAGRTEIESLAKRLNLKKQAIQSYGSPHGEVLLIPISKPETSIGRSVTYGEFSSTKSAKFQEWNQRMARMATTNTRPTATPSGYLPSDEDEPIRHNRVDPDRKNSRKENIRNQRRSSTKRSFPSDSGDDDE